MALVRTAHQLNRRISGCFVARNQFCALNSKAIHYENSHASIMQTCIRTPSGVESREGLKKVHMMSQPIYKAIHCSCVRQRSFEDNKTKDLTIWSNIKQVKSSPLPALSLGISGLAPFVGAPAYMVMHQIYLPNVALAQVTYAATILAFLGGVRWGFTIPEENPVQPDWLNLGYSVTLSLVALGGLLLPETLSLMTLMGGLALAGYVDMAMYGYPPWFKGLRFILTFVAVLSLWTTFLCRFMLDKNQAKRSD